MRFFPAAGRARLLATFALAALLLAIALGHGRLSTDIADFLPQGQTEAARFMLEQVRSGPAATLVVLAIEGLPPPELAAISRAFAARLDAAGVFRLVANGAGLANGPEQAFLFRNRYALSPAVRAEVFSEAALRADFARLLAALATSAAPLVSVYGLADPTAAFPPLLRLWAGPGNLRAVDGVWFARDRDRALLLVRTRASGVDLAGQRQAEAAIRAAFGASAKPGAHLLMSGPAVFALAAERTIRGDAETVSVLSALLVLALLAWRFQSPLALAAVLIPVLLGSAAAVVAVQAAFGQVHALTLGFGITMLGVGLDYPVLWIGHRRPGEAIAATAARIGRTLALSVTAAALGLAGMLFSAFPGLAELGLFALVGLVVAALATRLVLAPLVVAAAIAPASRGAPAWLLRLEGLRRFRAWAALPIALAALVVIFHPPRLERDLARLSPVPQAALDLDAALRGEAGAPEVARLAFIEAETEEAVLVREEALLPALDALIDQGAIGGVEIAARYLPSVATQARRRAALPPAEALAARIARAQAGMPFRADAFDRFRADIANARAAPPLRLADITPNLLAARLAPLLFAHAGRWYGVIAPTELAAPAAFGAALTAAPGVRVLDVAGEMTAIVAAYTTQAWRWLALGAAMALGALAIGLRGLATLPRVLGPIVAAVLVTLAILSAAGVHLSLFHIVALQLMIGVALDYALFFARRQSDDEERARTFRTLTLCNAMTLLTFGLLAFCRTPLLQGIGLTVAVGVVAAMVFSFLLAGRPAPA